MPKTKQQEAQEKRLQANIQQARKNRSAVKKAGKKSGPHAKPPGKGGFFSGVKRDAPQTAQQTIPYREIYKDGICRVNDKLYTKTIQFFDINYQLAQADDKAQIFENYCDFLNYFDSTISVQLTFINQRANMQDFSKSIAIPPQGDEYDDIRREYAEMLKNQLEKGNNGLAKRKYITFGIEADDLRTAKMRLERVEADVLNNFKTLGVQAASLNGLERLELLHSQLHPSGQEKLKFAWSDLAKTGLSTKDFIAPTSFTFSKDGKTFRIGEYSGAMSFLQILAPELTDRMLAEFLDLDAQLAGGVISIDLMETGLGLSASVCAAGLDAQVAAGAARYRHNPLFHGEAAYLLSAGREICGPLGRRARFTVDGETFEADILMCAACNTRDYGGGFRAAPAAQPDDGLIDLIVVRRISRATLLRLLNRYKQGRHFAGGALAPDLSRYLIYRQARHITIELADGRGPITATADGECAEVSRLEIRLASLAARVILPAAVCRRQHAAARQAAV